MTFTSGAIRGDDLLNLPCISFHHFPIIREQKLQRLWIHTPSTKFHLNLASAISEQDWNYLGTNRLHDLSPWFLGSLFFSTSKVKSRVIEQQESPPSSKSFISSPVVLETQILKHIILYMLRRIFVSLSTGVNDHREPF